MWIVVLLQDVDWSFFGYLDVWFFVGSWLVLLWIWIGFSSDLIVFQERIDFSGLDISGFACQVLRVLNWLHIIVKAADRNVTDEAEVLLKNINR